MGLTTEASATTEITLAPELRDRITALLKTYHEMKIDADLLYDQMEIEKLKIKGLLDAEGIAKVQIDGIPVAVVRGTRATLDKQKFVALGGSLQMLENATVNKPKKPYLRIGAEKADAE